MTQAKDSEELRRDFDFIKEKYFEGLRWQVDFIKERKQKIKESIELIPKTNIRGRYDYLISERQRYLRMKTAYEIRKKLEDNVWFSMLPDAYNELIKHLSELITLHEKYLPLIDEDKTISTITKTQSLKLSDFFESASKYESLMKILITKGYCQPETFIWIDDKKGNKGLLAAIIKYLHPQGYYKDKARPTNEEILIMAKNTFGWEMSIDTIKRANTSAFDLSFIPSASSIE